MESNFKFWSDFSSLKAGRIKVFRRRGVSNRFYARFTFRGAKGYVQESLGTSIKEEAIEAALERYLQLDFRLKQGLSLAKTNFKELTDEYLAHMQQKVQRNEIKYAKFHHQELYIIRYFNEFFGEFTIGDIQSKELEQYREWRKNYWISGSGSKMKHITYVRGGKTIKRNIHESQRSKIVASSTVNSEETVLRAIFKFAVMKGYISANEVVQIKTDRVKWEGRSTFSENEYRKLTAVARSRLTVLKKLIVTGNIAIVTCSTTIS